LTAKTEGLKGWLPATMAVPISLKTTTIRLKKSGNLKASI